MVRKRNSLKLMFCFLSEMVRFGEKRELVTKICNIEITHLESTCILFHVLFNQMRW